MVAGTENQDVEMNISDGENDTEVSDASVGSGWGTCGDQSKKPDSESEEEKKN